jgi:hypothetical protein
MSGLRGPRPRDPTGVPPPGFLIGSVLSDDDGSIEGAGPPSFLDGDMFQVGHCGGGCWYLVHNMHLPPTESKRESASLCCTLTMAL